MGGIINKAIVVVPHQHVYIVEKFGQYQRSLEPGLKFLMPMVQKVAYKHSLKEQSYQIKAQNAVTKDNVIMQTDGVLYLKVSDPIKCSYGAIDPIQCMQILAQGVMRSEIGKLTLDQTFEERERINKNILENLTQASEKWGIQCLRYEIKDIRVSEAIKKVMNLEAESERRKRAEILKSEGRKTSLINFAEAIKKTHILKAEGRSIEIQQNADAQTESINFIANALQENTDTKEGNDAAKYLIARQYIESLEELAHPSKNLLLQNNLSDPNLIIDDSLELLRKDSKQNQIENKSNNNQQQQ